MTSSDTTASGHVFDAREFRRALGSFPTGVAIITTRDADGMPVGLTCNSFSSVSLEPPLVLWSLRRNSRSLDAFRQAGTFAINVLSEGQRALSARFASNIEKKFDGVDHAAEGLPLVDGSVARFSCRTAAEHEAGDHIVFIGEVESFEYRDEDPLVFHGGAYKAIAESLRDLAARENLSTAALTEARERMYGLTCRMACERATEQELDDIERNLQEIDSLACAGEMQRRAAAAMEFFHLISNAAHNPVLGVVAESLGGLVRQQVNASASATNWGDVHQPALTPIRWRILDRLRHRDADGAVAALAAYVQASPLATWSMPTA